MKSGWLCWIYWDLGEDLCGTPDPARRQLLARLVAAVGRSAGTSTFWPPALPAEAGSGQRGLVASPRHFWAGMQELGVRLAVVMGRRAAAAIGMPEAGFRALQWTMFEGLAVCMVWDVAEIAAQDARVDEVVRFLQENFRQLGLWPSMASWLPAGTFCLSGAFSFCFQASRKAELTMTSTEPGLCTRAPATGFRMPSMASAMAVKFSSME